jgi:hypothetical protein
LQQVCNERYVGFGLQQQLIFLLEQGDEANRRDDHQKNDRHDRNGAPEHWFSGKKFLVSRLSQKAGWTCD